METVPPPTTLRYKVVSVERGYWLPRHMRAEGVEYAVVDLATSSAHKGGNSWTIAGSFTDEAKAITLAASLNGGAA